MSDSAKCRIQYMSDLHLEIERTGSENDLFKFDFTKQANTLALLGDIGTTVDDRLFDWLNMQLARFPLVLFLAGNHEPYRSSLVRPRSSLELIPLTSCRKSLGNACSRLRRKA